MDESAARERLVRRRAELDEEDRMSAIDRAPVTLDQDSVGRLSRIDAMQVQAMALAAEQRRAAERRRIDAALKRIDAGEFGYCLTCGDEIAGGRLAHDPSLSQCLGCASGEKR
ncbi:MAG TPA: TraR/DksA family transcriptional regulator [Sphingomicrobium sp.]|nr:TraR/DksA family transcriptional regulator [Sphingomicrobium sp.]